MSSTEKYHSHINFIVSIIEIAIRDALRFRKPRGFSELRSILPKKEQKGAEFTSAEARAFLSSDCKIFRYYCGLIDLDHEWVAKKAWVVINKRDNSYKKVENEIRNILSRDKNYKDQGQVNYTANC
jgi:hypothetical protein